ncbi:MAG: hypothetical protein R3F25_11565 [Gammaproteobacteria bacterium]|jgi:hypothetical protein
MSHWKPKYLKQFIAGIFGYSVLIPFVMIAKKQEYLSLTTKMLIVLIPIIPFILAVNALAKNYREMDEFWQKVIAESFIWTLSLTAISSLGLGMLQLLDYVPRVSLIFVFPYMISMLGLSLFFVKKKYLS